MVLNIFEERELEVNVEVVRFKIKSFYETIYYSMYFIWS